jgi:hypothetical protein
MVTAVATVYQIIRNRNRDALRKLLGEGYLLTGCDTTPPHGNGRVVAPSASVAYAAV